ncbi:MAG: tetrathionate reductase family octaheme c-type cytochrome [Anaerolineales bacterium]|nr:tetrathionate reductase family octaheme c-type cytochrome [Anaerolineales bacterium]
MKIKFVWLFGAFAILLILILPLVYFWPKDVSDLDDPWAHVPQALVHTDHTKIISAPFETGSDVTRACLECHQAAAFEVMQTSHWTWESAPVDVPWRDEPATIGKRNQINNFCIGTQGNEKKCMTCHIGYGWEDENFDFQDPNNIDCLACHADTNLYTKGDYGYVMEGVDLLAAAQSVRSPQRDNCGVCHFDGGGGNAVKHGDLDEHLINPNEKVDIHMGGLGFQCISCHRTTEHQILGRMLADNYTIPEEEQVTCTDCHLETPHNDDRINVHTNSVACQTCHIPAIALNDPTKIYWDWSTAGKDKAEDHFTYLKIKGDFIYDRNFTPTYVWFNGSNEYRYLLGDKIDPTQPTMINVPSGSISDANSKIFPFKVHVALQPYDAENNILIQPLTARDDGFWTTFDWLSALEIGAKETGLAFSGQYGFTETHMYWPITHMVVPVEDSLQCDQCHGPDGRMDWQSLGYKGDPIEWGGRHQLTR